MWWTSSADPGRQPELVHTRPARGERGAGWERTGMRRVARGLWVRSHNPLSTGQRALVLRHHLTGAPGELYVSGHAALGLLDLPVGEHHPAPVSLARPEDRSREGSYRRAARTVTLGISSDVPAGRRAAATRAVGPIGRRGVRIDPGLGLEPVPGPWGGCLAHPVEALAVAAPDLPFWRVVACLDALLSREISVDTRDVRGWNRDAHPLEPVIRPGESRPRGHLWILGPMTAAGMERALSLLPEDHPGVARVATALPYARESVASPMETVLRLYLRQRGLPDPEIHHLVVLDGEVVRLALAWPGTHAALVYRAGARTNGLEGYGEQEHRLESLRHRGWSVRDVTLEDVTVPARLEALMEWVEQHTASIVPSHA